MFQRSVPVVLAVIAWSAACSVVQAEFFDYEPPAYTAGILIGNGWNIIDNGVPEPSDPDITVADDHPCADPYPLGCRRNCLLFMRRFSNP